MTGLIYIAASVFFGYIVLKYLFPFIFRSSREKDLFGKSIELADWMVVLSASYLTGTLLLTWMTYIFAWLTRSSGKPMLFGNLMALAVILIYTGLLVIHKHRKKGSVIPAFKKGWLLKFIHTYSQELIFIIIISIIYSSLIFHSFHIKDNTMFIGHSVYSDFGPHLSMIRSFSTGMNFPTEYPHFADGTVRYHFLFQFLAGNLEYLGMRLDWAFNLPSILSMVSFLMLLYSLAVLLLGKRFVGFLAAGLYIFRSSFAFVTYAESKGSIGQALLGIIFNSVHIGKTPYEEWGLWAQKTFINQRHFPFGLGIIIFALIIFIPLLKAMVATLGELRLQQKKGWIREFLLTGNAWLPKMIVQPAVLGVILGLTSFWNGAAIIGVLSVLVVFALFSKHRLEYLITASITLLLSILESRFFFGDSGSALNPQITIGFIANNKDLASIVSYYIELLGVLPFIAAAVLFILPKGARWLMIAFSMPLLLATTLQLTPDIVVNHKYVFVTIILINIFVAYFLYRLIEIKRRATMLLALILTFCLTITGVIDMITLNNIDKNAAAVRTDDPVRLWVQNNTEPNEIFLTDIHVTHPILLAGRKLFYGWPYFAWSAGYQTDERAGIVKAIYGGIDPSAVKKLVEENNISYIVIEEGNRNSEDYRLNEDLIKSAFELIYDNAGANIQIYKTGGTRK